MNVAIHITHSSDDDLEHIQSLATDMGFDTSLRGEFMGRQLTELRREMDLESLRELIKGAAAA